MLHIPVNRKIGVKQRKGGESTRGLIKMEERGNGTFLSSEESGYWRNGAEGGRREGV